MSMELFIFSDRQLGSIAEWQGAIDAEGFALHLSDETPFFELDGFLPMMVNDKETGFECVHWNAREIMSESPRVDFGHDWKYALAFRWGSDIYALAAAYMAGAAYARATGGVVLDCEENKILKPIPAAELARKLDRETPAMEAEMRRLMEGPPPGSN